jgi:hypothetical protein
MIIKSKNRRFLFGLIVFVVLSGILVMILIIQNTIDMVQDRAGPLYASPDPFPEWLKATGPEPGSSLNLEDAYFGRSNDGFWPGEGNLCARVDYSQFAFVGNEKEMLQYYSHPRKVKLNINGNRLLIIKPFSLLGRIIGERRVLYASLANRDQYLILCWEYPAESGLTLAKIQIQQPDGDVLEYEWAFVLTD